MCLLKAAEGSPATLVASQLLSAGQLTPSSIQRHNHTEETVEIIRVYTLVVFGFSHHDDIFFDGAHT